MIEIRVRQEDDADGTYLTEVPFNWLDRVLPAIDRWGGFDPYQNHPLSGQLVYRDGDAYFEVVIHNDPSDAP